MVEKNASEDSVIGNLRNKYDEFFSAERKAVNYILDNPQEAVMSNVSEIAKKSGVSEATVVRMCKHAGYEGYYQMRLLMSRDLGKDNILHEQKEVANTAKGLFDFDASRVAGLGETIDTELLIKIVGTLKKSRMVYIVAAGNTSPIAMDLGFRLERCGIPCSYGILPEHFLNHVSLGMKKDTIIAISRSGVSKQVVQAVNLAKRKGMNIVAITGEPQTVIGTLADYVVRIEDGHRKEMLEPDSHLCEMAINDAILYVMRHFNVFMKETGADKENKRYATDVELLLSEYKL